MKRPRKKMSAQKLALVKKFQNRGGQALFTPDNAEDAPEVHQAPPEASNQDFKHTLPTQGTLHRRHK